MSNVKIFENEKFGEVRISEKDGVIWFVGKDIADALEYKRPTKAINDHVDNEDKDEIPIQDSIGRMQNTPIINESGMYSLVLSSKMEKAKEFKRWVTSDIVILQFKPVKFIILNQPKLAKFTA
jgi:prophage antirepressor-like protein